MSSLKLRQFLSEHIKSLPKRLLNHQSAASQQQLVWQPERSPYKKPHALTFPFPGVPQKLIHCPKLTEIARQRFHDYLTSELCPCVINPEAIKHIDGALQYTDRTLKARKLSLCYRPSNLQLPIWRCCFQGPRGRSLQRYHYRWPVHSWRRASNVGGREGLEGSPTLSVKNCGGCSFP
ncbi:hypothetical protein BT69DRAFT_1325952 [Atractiella rhizophila]|nr:hypothetical protein BT69DRAFT_1325952 [Atractiella rhizophila]